MKEADLRAVIREMITQELEENSTSAATPGYMTPNAFQGTSPQGKKKHHANAAVTREYTLVEPEPVADPLEEGRSRYHELKNDDSATTAQKIGRILTDINKSLADMERLIGMAARLKQETNTPSSQLWKRSLNHLLKVEGRVIRLAHKIQELKK